MKTKSRIDRRSWILMVLVTLSGGYQDSYTYLMRDHVLAHAQTGNVVFLGQHLFMGDLSGTLKYLVPLFTYVMGLFLAEQYENHYKGKHPDGWKCNILLTELLLMFLVGWMPQSDLLNKTANTIISFTCGLQVHSFHLLGEYDYASTMCMGNMKKGLEAFSAYLRSKEIAFAYKALSYLAIIMVFIVGAGTGYLLSNQFGIHAIWVSCLLLIGALTAMMPNRAIVNE